MSEEIKNEEIKEEVKNEEISELDKLKLELEDYKKAYSLKLAEFQNFSKRKEKELKDFKEYASQGIILKMLDNLDNLERAITASNENKNYDALVEGLNMSVNNLYEVLKNEGVTEIEAMGQIYNPYEHHALTTMSDETKENNTVIMVYQKGYKLKSRVIRPAMVVINKIEEKIEENKEENSNE